MSLCVQIPKHEILFKRYNAYIQKYYSYRQITFFSLPRVFTVCKIRTVFRGVWRRPPIYFNMVDEATKPLHPTYTRRICHPDLNSTSVAIYLFSNFCLSKSSSTNISYDPVSSAIINFFVYIDQIMRSGLRLVISISWGIDCLQ